MKSHSHHARPAAGLLTSGLGARLAISLGCVAALWAVVLWALR
ncbi:hypothetical protein [Pseudothauera lacus]|nr:hypothetical protein [Pseudothauera lacus]